MALSTYSELKTTVANYLGRSDLSDQITDFVTLAETRLRRVLRLRTMLKSVSASASSGDGTVALPSDFIEVRDFYVDTNPRGTLEYHTPSAFTANARATESGKPVFYTISGQEFVLAPKPDSSYTLQLLYYAEPDFLSDSNTSNTFLANAPDALVYGSLIEAEPYLMNDKRLSVWASMLERAVEALNNTAIQGQYSGVPLSMKLTRK